MLKLCWAVIIKTNNRPPIPPPKKDHVLNMETTSMMRRHKAIDCIWCDVANTSALVPSQLVDLLYGTTRTSPMTTMVKQEEGLSKGSLDYKRGNVRCRNSCCQGTRVLDRDLRDRSRYRDQSIPSCQSHNAATSTPPDHDNFTARKKKTTRRQ